MPAEELYPYPNRLRANSKNSSRGTSGREGVVAVEVVITATGPGELTDIAILHLLEIGLTLEKEEYFFNYFVLKNRTD